MKPWEKPPCVAAWSVTWHLIGLGEQGKRADYLMPFWTVVPSAAERLHVELVGIRMFALLGEGDHAVADLEMCVSWWICQDVE